MNLFSITSLIIFVSSIGFGISLYAGDRRSSVNRHWFLFSLLIGLWSLGLFGVTWSDTAAVALRWQYLLDISAIFIPVLYFSFASELVGLKNRSWRVLSYILALCLAVFSFSQYFKMGVNFLYNSFYWINPGPLYFIFPLFFLAYVLICLVIYIQAYRHSVSPLFKAQVFNMFLASIVGFGGGITNFLPQVLNVYPFGNFLTLLYLFFMSYGVLKYKFISKRIISAQLLIGAVVLVFLFNLLQILQTGNVQDILIDTLLLILVSVFGVLIVRGVYREVRQREKIESLAKDLEETNERQEKLIHFVGHEVKGYLTKGEYAFSEMADGDYGKLGPETKILATNALTEMRKGVRAVTDILQAANLKRGTVTYEMKPVDLKELVEEEIVKLEPQAQEKGLRLEAQIDGNMRYTINADRNQFGEHVIRNLIDNATRYTPQGSVMVGLSKKDGKILFSVKDTGVGISEEDRAHLFTEGGRGKDSVKINVHSTGYGLYIAKQIVEAHGGKIWVESEGQGKGSTFFVELSSV